jgi:serine-type D-Ala-D-Ala endopeptidase (penicillin-binding protein 7)
MSKGSVVVDQKFKLRWLVSALVSVLALTSVVTADAAGRQRAPAASAKATKATPARAQKVVAKAAKSGKAGRAIKSTSGKAVKAGKSAKSLKVVKSSKADRLALDSGARKSRKASRNVLTVKSHGRAQVVRLATIEPLVTRPARVEPIAVTAVSSGNAGRVAIATPALSSSSRASFGQIYGLHQTPDPLELKSSVALVMDQDTNEILIAKNSDAVLPIASLTKLMTATVVVDARLSMDDLITITEADIDMEKGSSSRLAVGTTLSRGEALHLALMSSENRAAHALGRTYPGGMPAFVAAMNAKAHQLGMRDTHYVDPTGLNSKNQSSAKDLAYLVKAASQVSIIRELSTSQGYALNTGTRHLQFHNTNSLVKNPTWDIGLQKTGYIVEAGRCLVMQARMAGRKLIMVFLDSSGKYSRLGDAERVRRWVETATGRHPGEPSAAVVPAGKSTS